MYENGFQCLTNVDYDYFDEIFEEHTMNKDKILHFTDFKDIVMNHKKFNRMLSAELLEKVKKKIKEKPSSSMYELEPTLSIIYLNKIRLIISSI